MNFEIELCMNMKFNRMKKIQNMKAKTTKMNNIHPNMHIYVWENELNF